jgi:hypothetical protein
MAVCETCAASEYIDVEHDGIQVTVHRDTYLQADRERLAYALGLAFSAMDDHGWGLEGIKISGRSDLVKEGLD